MKLIDWVLNVGIHEDLPFSIKKRVRILNRGVFFGFITNIFFLVVTHFTHFHALQMVNLAATIFMAGSSILFYFRKYNVGFVYIMTVLLVFLLAFPLILGETSGSEYYLLLIAPIALIIFEKTKVAMNVFFIALSFFMGIKFLFFFNYHTPLIDTTENIWTNYIFASINSVSIFSLVFILLKSLKDEHEKYEVEIEKKNDVLHQQKEEINQINEEIKISMEQTNEQKHEIEKKNEAITASINYALRIQKAALPIEKNFENAFGKDHFFIFFRPRDIVSGDFYWLAQKDKHILLAVGDCTGHGVPGAFMSLISLNFLEQIVHDKELHQPAQILEQLDKSIRHSLNQNHHSGRDGLDICLIKIDIENRKLDYSGAMNPLYLVHNQELRQLKATKKPIGGFWEGDKVFEQQSLDLLPQTTIYLCSDGYQDQFGGTEKRKFMVGNFKNLLAQVAQKPIHQQKQILEKTLEEWIAQGHEKQIDDISILGICV